MKVAIICCMIAVLLVVCRYVNGTAPLQALGMLTIVVISDAAMMGRMEPLPAGFVVVLIAYGTIMLPVDMVWFWQQKVVAKPMERCIVEGKIAKMYVAERTPAPAIWSYSTHHGKEYDPKNLKDVAGFF